MLGNAEAHWTFILGLIQATAPGEYVLDERGYVERSASSSGAAEVDEEDEAEGEVSEHLRAAR